MNERFTSQQRTIVGSLILKTPGQNYVGCGFSPQKSQQLLALNQAVQEKKSALQKAEQNKAPAEELKRELKKAEDAYRSFATYWTYLSFCAANVYTRLARIVLYFFGNRAQNEIHFDNSSLLPLKDFKMTEIGADKAAKSCLLIGNSIFLVAGDALATVDPVTGLGCNTALQTNELFNDVLHKLKYNDIVEVLQDYDLGSQNIVHAIHAESLRARATYRPDAAHPTFHTQPT